MTSRFVVMAKAGLIAAALSAAAFSVFAAAFAITAERGALRVIQLHAGEFAAWGGIAQVVAIVLGTFALTRARTVFRSLGALLVSLLTIVSGAGGFLIFYGQLWSRATQQCSVEGCAGYWEANGGIILISLAAFAAAAIVFIILTRRSPARATTVRVGLLLLSALPFLTVLGLVGTLLLTRRDVTAERERELVDA